MKIFKYKLDDGPLLLPTDAKILTARWQQSPFGKGIMIWALVDDKEISHDLTAFEAIPTGGEVPNGGIYVSTVETPNGLVFHIFQFP